MIGLRPVVDGPGAGPGLKATVVDRGAYQRCLRKTDLRGEQHQKGKKNFRTRMFLATKV